MTSKLQETKLLAKFCLLMPLNLITELGESNSVLRSKIMPRMFCLVDSKVQEAEYFLDRILFNDRDFFGVQCDAVAFASSSRSITFAMQACLKGIPEFDKWYEERQSDLRADPLARFFNEFRRVSIHIGDNAVVGGASGDGKVLYYFGALPDLSEVPEDDVATVCTQYFTNTLRLVYDCYMKFPALINSQWRFTKEHFASMGKTIEDAIEEIGFPRGWSAVSGFDEDTQWRCLRKEVDGCNIQDQFHRWLGKVVPYPDH